MMLMRIRHRSHGGTVYARVLVADDALRPRWAAAGNLILTAEAWRATKRILAPTRVEILPDCEPGEMTARALGQARRRSTTRRGDRRSAIGGR